MNRAVEDFKRAVRDVDSRLDMLEWKVMTLEDYGGSSGLTSSRLLKEVQQVRASSEESLHVAREALQESEKARQALTQQRHNLSQLLGRLQHTIQQ